MTLATDILRRAQQGELRTAAGYDPRQYISPWTPEVDAAVFEMRARRVPFYVIAEKIGSTTAAVAGRYRRLKNDRKSGA